MKSSSPVFFYQGQGIPETRQINSQARQLIEAGEIYGDSLGQIEPLWRRLSRQAKS